MEQFYKIAKPNGWDFYTGGTINYRDLVGRRMVCPDYNKVHQGCGYAFHASRIADQCFIGGSIPCSLFVVEGRPVQDMGDKLRFRSLRVIEELNPAKHFKWRYAEAVKPIHPFKVKDVRVTEKHKESLEVWASVRAGVWDSVKDGVKDRVKDSIRASVRASVWDSVKDSVKDRVKDRVWASVRDSVWDSVWDGVKDRVKDRVWDSIRASVWDSVKDGVWAYIGYVFSPIVTDWKHIKHKRGVYPFQSVVDLWKAGIVASFDGEIWRLHVGPDGHIAKKVKL